MKKRLSILVALVATFALAGSAFAASGKGTSVIYSSLESSPLHGNMPSEGAEAYAFSEFGNAVTFSSSKNRSLTGAVVTMSSWGCQTGTWHTGDCLTASGATFAVPITFNVYNASTDAGMTPGALIATSTQTFAIPYRPSASPKCTEGRWFDNALKQCFNGLATNITFTFGGVALPSTGVVYGIAYNTTHYGYSPIGESAACFTSSGGCGYDSLNIALSTSSPSAGSNPNPGKIWQNSPFDSQYCDGGAAGNGTFRLDSPTVACWGSYIPAVQLKASA
jgi:hypothetical protein